MSVSVIAERGHGETNNVEDWNFRGGWRGLHQESPHCGDGSRCSHPGPPPPAGLHHHPDAVSHHVNRLLH